MNHSAVTDLAGQLFRADSGSDSPPQWPDKYNILGVAVSATTAQQAAHLIIRAAQQRHPAVVTALAVHGLVLASNDESFRAKINRFDLVAPDGQPVRWALNLLYHTRLPDRVYGPALMLLLCERAARANIPIYLYGSYSQVVQQLKTNLHRLFPELNIAGCEPSVFRPLSADEDNALTERVNASGASILFLGLGCPLQEHFAYDHRSRISAVQVCVGAAFDFHSGNKKMAPRCMQRHGLEWFYRLLSEPKRLWRRYALTNTIFLVKFLLHAATLKAS